MSMINENIKNNAWRAGLAVGILLALFLLIVSIKEIKSIAYVGRDVAVMNTISVTGKGEKITTPDIATFQFSVTENAKTVAEAQTKATTKSNAALKALQDAKIEKKDIKTTSYNINPHYEYQNTACVNGYCPGGKQVLTGYDVSQTIEVKIRDLDKAGEIFAVIGGLNVQNVNGLNFEIDDIEKAKAEARELAINDAKAKADKLASQLGVKIVRITSFGEDGYNPPVYYAKAGMAMDSVRNQSAPSPEIPAGEQKVTSNVTITYEIR